MSRTRATGLPSKIVDSTQASPPDGVNFTAFSTRLEIASRMRSSSPRTITGSGAAICSVTCFASAAGSKNSCTSTQSAARSKSRKRLSRGRFSTADIRKIAPIVTAARSNCESAASSAVCVAGFKAHLGQHTIELCACGGQRRAQIMRHAVADAS